MTTLRTPDADLDRAFQLAVHRAEALLAAAGSPPLAAALLGAGVRAPARALLRARPDRPLAADELAALAAAWHGWVGDGEGSVSGQDSSPITAERPDLPFEAMARLLADPDSADAAAATGLLDGVLRGLWGLEPDAAAGSLALFPRLPHRWPEMALDRVRLGSTVLDLAVRRRRGRWIARVRRVGGPAVLVTVAPEPPVAGPAMVDEVELGGGRARFQATDRHEIVFADGDG